MKDLTSTIMTCGSHLGLSLLLFCSLHASEQTCPPKCLCLSDTVSCSFGGLVKPPLSLPPLLITLDLSHNNLSRLGPCSFDWMPRLEKLWMAHNRIGALEHGVFRNVSGLRLLDLSSNQLRVVEKHSFEGLPRLEELRLFNNRITQVEVGSLDGLASLERVYFSLNQITHFPFFSIREHSHPSLATLDLSSNRLARLPWEEVKALPRLVQQGLYLHNNSLICNCSMYTVFLRWNLMDYSSAKDFLNEHICRVGGDPKDLVHFLRNSSFLLNCSMEKLAVQHLPVNRSKRVVLEGTTVRLDCQTSLGGTGLLFTWRYTSERCINQPGKNNTLIRVFSNGILEIRAATVNDSGLYLCTAVDAGKALSASREVNVTVLSPAADPFSTGYTTLLTCIVTLLLILLYLFLTPCRRSSCRWPTAAYLHIIVSSVFLPSERDQPKI
ncbi:amphoterin-induced protein 3 [Kryptolebias marmoratus]|uniref:Adhesion molecule with Ig like domain 3 n=1 Tax=Kryptolebias marmoratus TaxID=37003 RepID=A0A3Q3B2E9_KRYMA|nr:amphoterin-induced protein 3 [Kryptolebias marmoratus]